MVGGDTRPLVAADAVLALLGIDEPTKRQRVGALLVASALLRLIKSPPLL